MPFFLVTQTSTNACRCRVKMAEPVPTSSTDTTVSVVLDLLAQTARRVRLPSCQKNVHSVVDCHLMLAVKQINVRQVEISTAVYMCRYVMRQTSTNVPLFRVNTAEPAQITLMVILARALLAIPERTVKLVIHYSFICWILIVTEVFVNEV